MSNSVNINNVLGTRYDVIYQVAQYLPQIEQVALTDVDALTTAINEARTLQVLTRSSF